MASFQIQNSEVLARLKPFGITFEKSLSDLIKGIRAHSKESPESLLTFLDNAILECKEELSTTDVESKATAVLKLAYLEMYGFDMSWCNFQILEVMSSSKFQQKRIGYLAAMQSFKSEQDLLILATNQFKKDLNSHNHIEIGLALSGIATIVTPSLAKDIVDDVVMKLSHSKPYIRKKAVLALFKVLLQYPESLRSSLPRVIEKLDDTDTSVVNATITVVCEISKKNPHIFLGYLPKFFAILEDTVNNWLIIRILKLFQSLLKIEPRMKKRILPSILSLMSKTEATSLIYECISCIVNGGMLSADSTKDKEVAKQCIDLLMKFFETRDSNLKFVGLLALINILKIFPVFMHKTKGVSDVIMDCLREKDLIIKKKALEICQFLVTEDNITSIIKVLLVQLVPGEDGSQLPEEIKLEITSKICEIASQENYSYIPNFKWYITVLKDVVNMTLLSLPTTTHSTVVALSAGVQESIARTLGAEFKAVAIRVPSIRSFVLSKVVVEYVKDPRALQQCPLLMMDLYWIMGEYVDELGDVDEDEDEDESASTLALSEKVQMFNTFVNNYIDVKLDLVVQFPTSKTLIDLPNSDVLVILVQALVKLYCGIITDYVKSYSNYGKLPYDKYNQVGFFLFKMIKFFENWEHHSDYEVQERALSWLEFLRLSLDALTESDLTALHKLEKEELLYYKDLSASQKVTKEVESMAEEGSEEESDEEESESSEEEEEEDEEDEEEEIEEAAEVNDSPEVPHEDKELPQLLSTVLPSLFKSYQLNPISATAQKRIPLPEDLDLDTQINSPPDFCLVESEVSDNESVFSSDNEEVVVQEDPEKDVFAAKQRLERMKDDPYYITSSSSKKAKQKPRVLSIDIDDRSPELPSERESLASLKEPKLKKKSKKLRKEKVVILSEETVEGIDEEPEPVEVKNTNSKWAIHSTLESFDVNSTTPSDINETGKKDFEYDIDLDAMRLELAAQDAKKASKEKKKSSKRKKISKSAELTSVSPEAPAPYVSPSEAVNTDDQVVKVSTKKPKKKKKAVILE